MSSPEQFHRRQNSLTESDIEAIKAIVESVSYVRHSSHAEADCRFAAISPEDMSEAVKFFKNFNETISDSKKTVRNAVLGIIVLVVAGLLTEGIWSKIIARIKINLVN